MTAASALFYAAALVAAVAAAARAARSSRSPNTAPTAAQFLALATLAATLVVMATTTQAAINRVVDDGGKLVGNVFTLCAALAAAAVTLYTRYPPEQAGPKVRRRAVWLAPVLTIEVVTFFLPHPAALTGSFDGRYASEPELAVYTCTYALYLGAALADQTREWFAFSRNAPRFFKVGLRLLGVGSALGVVYALGKLAIVAQRLITHSTETAGNDAGVCTRPFSSASCTVAVGGPAVVVVVVALGVLSCIASTRRDGLGGWTQQVRTYWRLGPLWMALTSTLPEVRRDSLVAPGEPAARDMVLRVTRRYVEIRDALLLLGLPTGGPARDGGRAPARDQARSILAALHDPLHHRRTVTTTGTGTTTTLPDVGTDIDWLTRVAIQFTVLAA